MRAELLAVEAAVERANFRRRRLQEGVVWDQLDDAVIRRRHRRLQEAVRGLDAALERATAAGATEEALCGCGVSPSLARRAVRDTAGARR